MKKLSPLLITGFTINILYAILLASGYLATLAAEFTNPIATSLFSILSILIWLGLAVQLVSVAIMQWSPRFAFGAGCIATIPFLPLGLIFLWGLMFHAYEKRYAPFEKLLFAPKHAREIYGFAPSTSLFLVGIALVALAIGSFFVPFFSPAGLNLFAATCVFFACNCFLIIKSMYNKNYLYLFDDRLVFAPVPFKPLINLPYSLIESTSITDNHINLVVRVGNNTRTLTLQLGAINLENRTDATITVRNLLQKVCTPNQIIGA